MKPHTWRVCGVHLPPRGFGQWPSSSIGSLPRPSPSHIGYVIYGISFCYIQIHIQLRSSACPQSITAPDMYPKRHPAPGLYKGSQWSRAKYTNPCIHGSHVIATIEQSVEAAATQLLWSPLQVIACAPNTGVVVYSTCDR